MTTLANIMEIESVKRVNRDKAKGFWFQEGATRFFHCRYPQVAYEQNGKAYFVTSEQFDYSSPRLYTIRVCDLSTGQVDTVGEFQQYGTSREANRAMQSLIKWNHKVP